MEEDKYQIIFIYLILFIYVLAGLNFSVQKRNYLEWKLCFSSALSRKIFDILDFFDIFLHAIATRNVRTWKTWTDFFLANLIRKQISQYRKSSSLPSANYVPIRHLGRQPEPGVSAEMPSTSFSQKRFDSHRASL